MKKALLVVATLSAYVVLNYKAMKKALDDAIETAEKAETDLP